MSEAQKTTVEDTMDEQTQGETPEQAGDEVAQADAEGARGEIDQWKAKAYRAAADLDNARKRMLRELEDARKFAIDGVLRDLFPVADNLERALSAAPSGDDPVVQGVKMVLNQMGEMLKRHGAISFDPKGEPFDPQFHEAMSQIPMEGVEPGTVAEVFQKGWRLHDRLVRPAMVVVAAAPPSADEGDA